MVAIPKDERIGHLIEEKLKQKRGHRGYIGYSGLGHKCQRKVWYDFRWAYDSWISHRLNRIFAHGDYEELAVVEDLKAIGVVIDLQQSEVTDETGHIKGHIDGVAINVPGALKTRHLFECKTMNDKRFADYIKNGLKATNPVYWVQIQMYMGRFGLKRCLFAVTNKNTEERDFQRYDFDQETYDMYNAIALEILTAEEPPPKIGNHTYFECKWCDAHELCHKKAEVKRTCRTCSKVNIEMKGKWSCSLTNKELSHAEQLAACDEYKCII